MQFGNPNLMYAAWVVWVFVVNRRFGKDYGTGY